MMEVRHGFIRITDKDGQYMLNKIDDSELLWLSSQFKSIKADIEVILKTIQFSEEFIEARLKRGRKVKNDKEAAVIQREGEDYS
jgi:frataxin-like iron-binding protein CyaY